MKIINKITGETVFEFVGYPMALDEALRLFGVVFPENWDENVLIGGKMYYYDDLDIIG